MKISREQKEKDNKIIGEFFKRDSIPILSVEQQRKYIEKL